MQVTRKQLGKRLRWWREIRGISQGELAAAIDKPATWISHIENGKRWPQVDSLYVWVRYLGIEDYLFQSFGENGYGA